MSFFGRKLYPSSVQASSDDGSAASSWNTEGWTPRNAFLKAEDAAVRGSTGTSAQLAYDPNFKGPVKSRRSTDLSWIYGIAAVWVGLVPLGVFSMLTGEPLQLIYGRDMQNRLCGCHKDTKGLTELYYPYDDNASISYCLRECPGKHSQVCLEGDAGKDENADDLKDGNHENGDDTNVNSEGCEGTSYVAPHSTYRVYHRCLPQGAESGETVTAIVDEVDRIEVVVGSILYDVYRAKMVVMVCFVFSAVFSFVSAIMVENNLKAFLAAASSLTLLALVSSTSLLLFRSVVPKEEKVPFDTYLNDSFDTHAVINVAITCVGEPVLYPHRPVLRNILACR